METCTEDPEQDYYGEEPSDTDIARQVSLIRDELTRLAEWCWYGLGGDMTLALRESLRENGATWADDAARRITAHLTEYRLRQLGLDGDEEKCGRWTCLADDPDADDPE